MGLIASCLGIGSRPPTSQGSLPPPSDGPDPELARIFRCFDANGDGRISAEEMRAYFRCTAAEAEKMVAAVDSDGDGLISMEEFGELMKKDRDDGSDTLRAAFEEYDEDGDGVITAEELQRVLRRLGHSEEDRTAERCAKMIAAVDVDGDGAVSFDEFKAMMLDGGAIRPASRSLVDSSVHEDQF